MRPVSSHILNLSIVYPQGFGVERAEQQRAERERRLMERERAERERAERERVANETSKLSFSQSVVSRSSGFGVERAERELLFRCLKPVSTSYRRKLCCMDGPRQSLLNQVMDWVANKSGQENVLQGNAYWIYGSPGIGKTSLAHSICASLDGQNHLAGAFFCRRDDPNLSEPRNILPTFIHKLAILFPPFRTIVSKHLRDDPNLTLESIEGSLFLDFIRSLPRDPERTLAFVIKSLDECGDAQNRPRLLEALTNTASQAPWLKIIITSRTEGDIQHFFGTLTQSSCLPYDLATDQDASADLRTFTRRQFDLVASHRNLDTPWPEEADLNRVISRANGLFIFVKTLVLALKRCTDPEEYLKAVWRVPARTVLEPQCGVYDIILKAQQVHSNAEPRPTVRALLSASPPR